MKFDIRSIVVATVVLLTGCGDLEQPDNPAVDGGEVVVSFSPELMKKTLIKAGVVDENRTVFGYTAYKIPYMTTDEEDRPVKASGLMVIPTGLPAVVTEQIGLSMVSDDHGTIFANNEAPGVIGAKTNAPSGSAVIMTALAGFVTLQPDYIGFGDSSDHYHPFILKKSLANATVDFIKASKAFATKNNIKLNGQLFLTGYSEGGYAAMATLQKIENEGELQVTMAIPMAGPYALKEMSMGVLSQEALSVPSFMANVGYAYAKAYEQELSSVINEPYASKLDDLFNGTLTRVDIDPHLTTKTTGEDGLFNPIFINDFFNNSQNNWFMQAVTENSVSTWAPQTTVKLVHCQGDDVIPFGISQLTKGTMDAYGAADVSIVPVEAAITGDAQTQLRLGHGECGKYAYSVAAQIFAATRAAVYHY